MSKCIVLIAAISLCACGESNPYFCKGAPLDNCTLIDAPPDVPSRCTINEECTSPMAMVCEVGSGACVQCTPSEASVCAGATPVCISNSCQKCTDHTQCASAACLPDGTCGTDVNVAYVDPDGTDNQNCSKMTPCNDVTKALATDRPYLKFHGTTDQAVSVKAGRVVTFLADPGAILTRRSGNGAILTVQDNGTSVSIYDLSISNAPNDPNGIGCLIPTGGGTPTLILDRVTISNNPGGGISTAAGALTVSRSVVSQSGGAGITMTAGGTLNVSQSELSQNRGGGILMSADSGITLTNNIIHHNGDKLSSAFGGLSLRPTPGSVVQFNTIVDNEANAGAASAGGIFCDVTGFIADNNLIFRNTGGQALTTQTFGICTYGKSFIAGAPVGDNTPMFVRPNLPPVDYHLTASTPTTIRDAAGNCTGVDYDGDMRPIGPACDLGADEYRP